MTVDIKDNNSSSLTGEIFHLDNDEPLMKIAFDVLEINSKTSKREIRSKFKELVKKFHPDINGQNATNEEKLKDIINAYNELKSSGFC